MTTNQGWNKMEFITFLLIHAAYTDLEFTEDEKEAIQKDIDINTFNKIEAAYNDCSEYECLQTILSYKELYYPTEEQKKDLLNKIHDLFNIDGSYSKLEKNLMLFLEKIM